MRRLVAPVLCTVMMVAVAGCTARASLNAGVNEPQAAPPPPPPPTPVAPAPAPEPPKAEKKTRTTFKMKGFQLDLPGAIVFKTGTAEIEPVSEEVLNVVDSFLKTREDVSLLRVEGHTDSDGDDAKNQTLSEQRAMAVARWLVAKGNDCKRLLPVGFGETKPIADNATAEGKAQNRRTSFFIAAIKGKPVDGQAVDAGGKVAGDSCK